MNMQLFFVILISIPLSFEIQFQCPGPQQWNMRAISHCQRHLNYVCLWNSFELVYNETCIGPFEEAGGYRVVQNINGNLDVEKCPLEYYQPESINFQTLQGDNCLYQKSLCSEVGQVSHSNGSTTTDRTCRCDYTMGYAFVSSDRKNPCYCVTSEEDCTCYSTECVEEEILSPDYRCIRKEENHTQFNCSELPVITKDSTTESSSNDSSSKETSGTRHYVVAGIATIPFIVIFAIICLKSIQIYRWCGKPYAIKRPDDLVECLEGENCIFTSVVSKGSAMWFKDYHSNTTTVMDIVDINGKFYSAYTTTIKNMKKEDQGIYLLKTDSNIICKSELCFKSQFKSDVKVISAKCIEGYTVVLQCTTNGCNGAATWKKDGGELNELNRIVIEKQEEEHKLTIKDATVADSGIYTVFYGKAKRYLDVKIKEFIKTCLVNTVIMEGGDVILKCELEEEDEKNIASVEWLKNGSQCKGSDNIKLISEGTVYKLIIFSTKLEHNGRYEIVINQKYKSAADVEVKPQFRSDLKVVSPKCIEGQTVELQCTTNGWNGTVTWKKDGIKIQINELNRIVSKNQEEHTLTIKHATVADSGKYTVCHGKAERCLDIKIQAFIKKHLVPMVIMEGLDVTLECEIEKGEKEQNISVQWLKDGCEISDDKYFQAESDGEIYKMKIDPAEPHHKGKYKIMFMNKYESEAYLDVNPMPVEIKELPKESRDAFLKAAKTGTKKRYFLRTIIVGKEKSGKTCLLRRLLNREINDVKSTNCLEVASCQISLHDGKWKFSDIKNDISMWDEFADCGLWDFAGQREYYATHQIFLTPNAIYILTVDISEDLSTLTDTEMQEKEFVCVGDYINFWIDNIHCYAKYNERTALEKTYGVIYPAVIIVGTGIDKYKSNEDIMGREEMLNMCIKNLLGKQLKRNHLRKVYTLSNTEPSEEKTEFEELRNVIYKIAETLPKWGEHLPIRWILLEKEIQKVQDTTKIMSFTDILNLAKNYTFSDEREVLSFLNYEHNVGNLIFFDTIKENIVLDPMWLVLALRCLVAPEDFRNEFTGNLDWVELTETGLLSDRLINQLFETQNDQLLLDYKPYVMQVMEAFNIVIKMHDGRYYLPSLIKPTTFEEIITKFKVSKKCKTSSWLCLDFTFLPPSFFNHILVGFISKGYKLAGKNEGEPALFQGIGVFSLTSTSGPDSKYLVTCVFRNLVALQIWERDTEVMCNSDICKDLREMISNIQRLYRIDIKYKIQLLCSNRSHYKSNKRKDIFELIQSSKFYCLEHDEYHQSDDLCRYWYTILEQDEANIQKTAGRDRTYRHVCHVCDKEPSVSWCHDCQKTMCNDCSHQHSESTYRHILQHVQDTYLLDYNFKIDVESIFDMKMLFLNGGLLVIADYRLNQLVTCHISGQQRHTIPLPGKPWCIAVVDDNTVAVTLTVGLEPIVVIVDIKHRHVKQSIYVKVWCKGVMYRNNQLFVGCGDKTIHVMNMSGEVTRTIPVGVVPEYICGSKTGRIFGIDRNKLFCIDTAGNSLFTVSNPDMSDPCGITTDDEGHVLVICQAPNNVLRISPDGKQKQTIITQIIPSVNMPSIYYDSLSKSLLIGRKDNVYVYKKM